MITSMIDQEFTRVHKLGMKNPKSLASSIVALALDGTGQINWHNGKLIGFIDEDDADISDSIQLEQLTNNQEVPSYFLDMMVSLDLRIPPAEVILKSIDPNFLIMSYDAPAFHIPMGADIDYLAICVVATRIAWECKSSLILPEPSHIKDFEHLFLKVGINSLLLGSHTVYKKAKDLLDAPSLWDIKEDSDETIKLDFAEDSYIE